jgi:CRP-like cAMP-binding protein
LCNISSPIAQKNPKQLQKTVRSSMTDRANPIHIIRVEDEAFIRSAVEMLLAEPSREVTGDRVRAEILKRQLPFSISEIEEACPGISRNTVRVILSAMQADGLIAQSGKGRGAKWSQVNAQG